MKKIISLSAQLLQQFNQRERVDKDLQKMIWDGGNGIKYISFKNSTSEARLGALHMNELKKHKSEIQIHNKC